MLALECLLLTMDIVVALQGKLGCEFLATLRELALVYLLLVSRLVFFLHSFVLEFIVIYKSKSLNISLSDFCR